VKAGLTRLNVFQSLIGQFTRRAETNRKYVEAACAPALMEIRETLYFFTIWFPTVIGKGVEIPMI